MKFLPTNYTYIRHIIINRPAGNPSLLSTDPVKVNGVSLNYHYYLTTARFYRATADRLRGLAQRLIEWIKKEYHFE